MELESSMENKKILYIYDGGHPLFESLMKSIGAKIISNKEIISKDYDIYIFEGSYIRPVILKKIGKLGIGKKVVSWISDPRLYYLDQRKSFNFSKEKIVKYPLFKKTFMIYFLRRLDGVFCMGDLIVTLMKKYSENVPVMKVSGFISNKRFSDLEKIKPNLESHNLLFIGNGPDYYCKGIDILIESFKTIKENIKDAKLYIIGNWDIRKEWVVEGVYFLGFQKNLIEIFRECSLGIHLARGEAFGINVLEMMLAGLPTITSELTGSKEVVNKFDPDFILELDKKKIVEKVVAYFNSSLEKRVYISNKSRSVAKNYSEKKITEQFRNDAESFLKKIYN